MCVFVNSDVFDLCCNYAKQMLVTVYEQKCVYFGGISIFNKADYAQNIMNLWTRTTTIIDAFWIFKST